MGAKPVSLFALIGKDNKLSQLREVQGAKGCLTGGSTLKAPEKEFENAFPPFILIKAHLSCE